jgi:CheY-like chemotaxis protein
MANEHILIIDDNLNLIAILERILQPVGYQISHALDGHKGMAFVRQVQPDLILLDMYMPKVTGLQLLRQLREEQFTTPVIFMTAQSAETIVIEAFRLGVADYLIKPFQTTDLLQTVDRALLSPRLEREKEQLASALQQAETVQQTAATLSHYINNSLVAAVCGLDLIYEMAAQCCPAEEDIVRLTDIFTTSRGSLERIETVLKTLKQLTNINLVDHDAGVVTIDIDEMLEELGGETAVFLPTPPATPPERSNHTP